MENNINKRMCITNMKISSADFKRLPMMHRQIVWELARIEADINYCDEFKTNPYAQEDLIYLKDDKKYYQGLKERVEKRLKQGY